jgi:hypothetical protein
MQIGQGAQWIERGHLVVVLPWDLPWFPRAVGNSAPWL